MFDLILDWPADLICESLNLPIDIDILLQLIPYWLLHELNLLQFNSIVTLANHLLRPLVLFPHIKAWSCLKWGVLNFSYQKFDKMP